MTKKVTAIIPAAGTGSRYSTNRNKLLETFCGKPVIAHTLAVIAASEYIENIIICTSGELMQDIKDIIKEFNIPKIKKVIKGGETRQESVYNGLLESNNADIVLIHDAARPLVSLDIINKCIETALSKKNNIAAVRVKDTIKKADKVSSLITETVDRSTLWSVQTPQVFVYKEILEAHEKLRGCSYTDDSGMIEELGKNVFISTGSYENIKITTSEDLLLAEMIVNTRNK